MDVVFFLQKIFLSFFLCSPLFSATSLSQLSKGLDSLYDKMGGDVSLADVLAGGK